MRIFELADAGLPVANGECKAIRNKRTRKRNIWFFKPALDCFGYKHRQMTAVPLQWSDPPRRNRHPTASSRKNLRLSDFDVVDVERGRQLPVVGRAKRTDRSRLRLQNQKHRIRRHRIPAYTATR